MPSTSTRTIRVAAFLPYPTGHVPGQRFRIEQWASLLREKGIDIVFSSFLKADTFEVFYQPGHRWRKLRGTIRGYARRVRELRALDGFDLVYVYREAALAGPTWIERSIAQRLPIVFDFDDAIYLVDVSAANRPFAWLKSTEKARTLCRISSSVVVGNSHLAEFARRHNPRVTVVPSSIDTRWYRPAPVERLLDRRPVLGWMGSSTSQRYLEQFAPVLRCIAQQYPVEIRVISDSTPDLDGLPVVWRRWTAETEATELSEFDVGIMPLPDTPWTRGKCAMKALQYMGVAVPVVASPVGMNNDVIRHGVNGFLAGREADWMASIGSLVGDPVLRRRVGAAGRLTVEREYSAAVCAARFAEVLRDACERSVSQYSMSHADT